MKKWRAISHEKKSHLGKSCVTMKYLMVKLHEKTELRDDICEECSNSSGKTSKANFEKICTKNTNATKNISSNIIV